MKRFIALLMALTLCFALCACKKNKEAEAPAPTNALCTQQELLTLIEQNADCYYFFYVSPLEHTDQQNSDGYMGVAEGPFDNYETLRNLVLSTYTKSCAETLLSYPSADAPLYKEAGGGFFVNPEVKGNPDYNLTWNNVSVEITNSTQTECSFKTTTTSDDYTTVYTTSGKAVYEDGKWRLAQLIY